MKYIYSAVIHCDEDGVWVARVPDIPGCVTTGSSLEDAIDQIADAAAGCLIVAEDEDLELAAPSPQSQLPREPGDVCTLLRLDTLAYRAATDSRSVRKNVSLPAWMAGLADKRGINCSQLLQEALLAELD